MDTDSRFDETDVLVRPSPPQPLGDFLPIERVIERVALGKSSIYKMIREGRFPKPVQLNDWSGRGTKCVAWVEADIVAWQEWKIRESRGTVEPWTPPENDHG